MLVGETIRKGGGSCNDSEYALLSKKTGKTLGCHPSKEKAREQEKAIKAHGAGLDRIIDALVEGVLLPQEAMLVEVELPEQTDDLPDPEEEGSQYLKTSPIWAMQMDREFDVVTLEGPVTGDDGDWLAKNPETGETVADQR